MKRFVLFATLVCFTALLLGGCGLTARPTAGNQGKLKVYTAIYPLYDFARQIGGDRLMVKNIVPAGAEPHDWEPSPQDVAEISQADVLILSGTGVEPWADKVLSVIDQNKVAVIYAGRHIDLSKGIQAAQEPHRQSQANHPHEHDQLDPHVWLDPLHAKTMVDNILAGLVKADEKNKDIYEANAQAYKKELEQLHQEFQRELAGAQIKEFITSHDAFGYLAKRYNLTQVPVRGLTAESEPSPADMAAVVKLAREKNIKHIFFETMVSPKVSQAIAAELGGQTLVLDPLESLSEQDMAKGKDYLAVMRENLQNLKIALAVQ
ncbi:metal ABC transporter substrate-binding protein [Desulforamulus hydrothermalis]|uniref:Putative zinc transport system zinc-binding lipoprotein AdcA n=1 Tax=Desulforamulus hydrothermalis Lam5 = DSM 18033 TaxID=1121428 RepID=K8DYW6_9FIRM|nr:metal ABC transporter substrate-binding protein [Desulforamulus hydrothermalis]CCO08030.1 putative zinc transport system zinc-binding lipoprotein AdcA [Desulforamulus hydrothermalis Lam5 = DSM 18033]SHG83723.1 zinc transport system substrate-binding protein [Desulforamulus hydrothermalis Lam5 = DSM 18033]